MHSLLWEEAQLIGGVDPDFHRRDLADAIESGALPEWDLGVQVFSDTADQLFEGIDLLDPTKIVPEELAPVQILGTMTLTANPTNYFAELGGPNFSQIPVNRPHADINDMYRDGMHQTAVHQGVALTIPPYEYAEVDELLEIAADRFEPPLLVALDGITDPRNLGAILRSADAFGAHGVILPERRSVSMTASVWKVAAGAAGRVRVAQVTNLNRTLAALKEQDVFVLGLDADGDVTSRELELGTQPTVLVVGAEGKGLSRLARETSDQVVSIPMAGRSESLNASVAAAIALYEISGVRDQHGLA